MVRSGGLEPPRVLPHSDLNAARLPIPPRPQVLAGVGALPKPTRHLKPQNCGFAILLAKG